VRFLEGALEPSRLASDPTAAPNILAQLAQESADPAVLQAIAQNPQTLITVRAYITLNDGKTEILLALARNPHSPGPLLEMLHQHPTVTAIQKDLDANPNDISDFAGYVFDPSRELFLEALREALARHPNTPEALLEQLAKDKQLAVGVAQNPNASAELLLEMVKRFRWNADRMLGQIARHPNAPAAVLDRIACLSQRPLNDIDSHPNASPTARATVAFLQGRAEASEQVFDMLFAYGDYWALEQIAKSPTTPLAVLGRLVDATYPTIRVLTAVAAHTSSTTPILQKISDILVQRHEQTHTHTRSHSAQEREFKDYQKLFMTIVQHPNCDAQVLATLDRLGPSVRLFQMTSWEKQALARATITAEDMLRLLAHDLDQNLLGDVARNPNTPLDVLEALLDRRSELLDDVLVYNPRATPEMLRTIYRRLGPSRHVAYRQLAAHPNTPRDILENLARSRSRDILAALARNPNAPGSGER
jgi:hypothetical protein